MTFIQVWIPLADTLFSWTFDWSCCQNPVQYVIVYPISLNNSYIIASYILDTLTWIINEFWLQLVIWKSLRRHSCMKQIIFWKSINMCLCLFQFSHLNIFDQVLKHGYFAFYWYSNLELDLNDWCTLEVKLKIDATI